MDQTKPQDQSLSGYQRERGHDANNGGLVRVLTAGLFEVPVEDQQKSSANNTLTTAESVYQTILTGPFAAARSKWLATATAKTRAGAKLSGTAVGRIQFRYKILWTVLNRSVNFIL